MTRVAIIGLAFLGLTNARAAVWFFRESRRVRFARFLEYRAAAGLNIAAVAFVALLILDVTR